MRVLLVQGANMEWLGRRQPELYGTTTAAELDAMIGAEAESKGVDLDIFYSNIEGEAITRIYQAARDGIDGLLMNPAGFLYQGFALRDCLRGVRLPYIEVHMTNLEKRGMHSVLAEESAGMIVGLGLDSYSLGLEALIRVIRRQKPT
ncbi:MAG: type II 3-dehydroquinate dehydratase [Alphaproteobacteria bacterium]|nr:type II 3-dehydroquinate dehydratase [Alphaproteobacteria bacterium]